MFKQIVTTRWIANLNRQTLCKFCQTKTEPSTLTQQNAAVQNINYQIVDTRNITDDDYIDVKLEKSSPLEECKEDISHVAPYLKPTFNFAAYVNKSNTLQELLKLGVNLHILEKKEDVPQFILQLDFERDIKQYIIFFHDLGLQVEDIATLITKNPFILKESLDDLQVRLNYLQAKKFDKDMILRIVSKNAFWLSFRTQDIDEKLGFFQKQFKLSGKEVRTLATKKPNLITYDQQKVKINKFVLQEEMGFSPEELKKILLNKPTIFIKAQNTMLLTFEYVHKTMNVPLETIAEVPEVLTCRTFRIKQRHMFLEKLGRVQLDPKKPNYTSLISIISGDDAHFCTEVAKSSVHTFNEFLKTL